MLTDNFSLFNLFLDKKIKIYIDNNSFFHLRVPTIREFYLRDEINGIYHLITKPAKELKKIIPIQANIENSLDFVEAVLFQLAIYKEYHDITKNIKEVLQFFIPELEFDYQIKKIKIKNIIITSEIWEYVLYLLKLSCGEKVEKPRTFASEDERKFYMAQKEMDEKIKRIKTQAPGDAESLLKAFLSIQYKFNLSFDYLGEQTLAQIHWLHQYAAGAVSYEVNAKAFAAGNMKKGAKLDFFIK